MKRRDFLRSSVGVSAGIGFLGPAAAKAAEPSKPQSCSPPFPATRGLTRYVAGFIAETKLGDIPSDVIELGKKSLLDGIGLALAGSKLQTRHPANVHELAPVRHRRSERDWNAGQAAAAVCCFCEWGSHSRGRF